MTTFFLLLILFFIIYPMLRALWAGFKLHRNWRKATEGFRDAYRRAAGSQPQQPKPKKKKIDPNVGEYVAFEEIKTETTAYSSTETSADGTTTTEIKVESQIEDAVWEDIK